jgi:hypothetical protein
MGKTAQRQAEQQRQAKAAALFNDFREGSQTFAGFLNAGIQEGLFSGGQLKKEYGISHTAIAAAKNGEASTGVPTERRERFLRDFAQVNNVTYTPPVVSSQRYAPVKTVNKGLDV